MKDKLPNYKRYIFIGIFMIFLSEVPFNSFLREQIDTLGTAFSGPLFSIGMNENYKVDKNNCNFSML